MWALGLAVVAHGVWRPRSARETRPEVGLASLWVVGLAALVVLLCPDRRAEAHAPYLVVILAAATLLACGGRTLEAFVRVRDLAAVRKQALTDDLTQVGNRRLLYQRTEQALRERAEGRRWRWSCSTSTGSRRSTTHSATTPGTHCCRSSASGWRRRSATLGPELLLARLGGDEFAVLVPDVGLEDATALAQRLHDCLTGPVQLDNILLHTKASVGLALSRSHADNRSDLLRCADLAMYHAKRSGRGVAVYEPGLLGLTRDRLEMAEHLQQGHPSAASSRCTTSRRSTRTGDVPSVEALVRWQHPTLGMIAAGRVPPDRRGAAADAGRHPDRAGHRTRRLQPGGARSGTR